MKKFFLAISLVAMLGFVAVPANALLGVPDDVPGTDILVPFFYVSMPGFGQENTLLTITDVKAPGAYNGVPGIQGTNLHMTAYTIDSFPAANLYMTLTPFDVWSRNMLDILMNEFSIAQRAAFEVDTDLIPGNDHWAGYLIFFNNSYAWPQIGYNNLISHIYQVYLVAGMAASYNGVSWENDAFFDFRQIDPGLFFDEAFSPNALWVGQNLLSFAAAPAVNTDWFRLLPRYYVNDAVAQSLLMIWMESFLTRVPLPWGGFSAIPLPGLLHVYFFNEDEDVISGFIDLDNELNIIDVGLILPGGLFTGYPWGGWIDITTPDVFNAGWWYPVWNPIANNFVPVDLGAYRQWIGYSWQRAIGPAAEAWEVMHPIHRDTGLFIFGNPFGTWVPPWWW